MMSQSLSNEELEPTLERLYLGQPRNYELIFSRRLLNSVEEVFDRIISHHGIRGTTFQFVIRKNKGVNVGLLGESK